MNVFIQTHTNKFFKISMPPKSKPKFIQQHHKLPTLAKFMSHQHCPSYTMTKKYNDSKMLQSQDYNMVNHAMPQISTRPHNNTMTMSQHQTLNGTWKQHFSQKKKKKTHLEVHVEHGSWGLEGAPPHHPIQVMDDISFHESKKIGPIRGGWHFMQKKRGVWKWFHKNGYEKKWPKTQGSEKILREMSEGRLQSLGKWFF